MAKRSKTPQPEPVASFLPHTENRTKIVCTIGPRTASPEMIEALVRAGADIFRLNFSHGTHEAHRQVICHIRTIATRLGRPVSIFGDLCGPKIRIGAIANDRMTLAPGENVTLTPEPADGGGGRLQVSFRGLARAVKKGDRILLDDGALRFEVLKVKGEDVLCEVRDGGVLKSNKGVNFPNIHLPIPSLTPKDRADLRFAIEEGVDAIAQSFVRDAHDLKPTRRILEGATRRIPLLAKIEKVEAVENLAALLDLADGAMVARGDLGVELPVEKIASIQKRVINLCNRLSKPVITATQMLESMIHNPRPTRAEVTDVYNAIIDGTDCVMLSGETAVGSYPVEAVETMARIAIEAERDLHQYRKGDFLSIVADNLQTDEAISRVAVMVGRELRLDAIVVPTTTGSTARRVARFRPRCPILACSHVQETVRTLQFTWGVEAAPMNYFSQQDREEFGESEAHIRAAVMTFRDRGQLRSGMRVVVLAGLPLNHPGHTNMIRVIEVE